ncbi:hypothetical protein FACS1894141_3200 [Spirochaetia bacterium]|nr:hypothetical protein FACS1894141_3200 [Spirochaetia bacterium]
MLGDSIRVNRDDDRDVTSTKEQIDDSYNHTYSRNIVEALLGFGTMGIKLGFIESLTIKDQPDDDEYNQVTTSADGSTVTKNNTLESYSFADGFLDPRLGYGITLNLGSLQLKPSVDVTLSFIQESEKKEVTDFNGAMTINGVPVDTKKSVITGKSKNRLMLYPRVGAVAVLAGKENSEINVGLQYALDLNIALSNDYDVFGNTGSVTGEVEYFDNPSDWYSSFEPSTNTQTDKGGVDLLERSYTKHTITPSFAWYKQVSDDLHLAVGADLGVGITSETQTKWNVRREEETRANPYDSVLTYHKVVEIVSGKEVWEKSALDLRPVFKLGVTYALVPEKFTVNAGARIGIWYTSTAERFTPKGYGTKTITTKNSGVEGEVVTVDYEGADNTDWRRSETSWGLNFVTPSAGFTLNFTPKSSVDMAVAPSSLRVVFTLKN